MKWWVLQGLLAALLVACGGGSGGSDEDQIRDLNARIAKAFTDLDASAFVDVLDSESKRDCGRDYWEGVFALFRGSADWGEYEIVETRNIRIDGTEARAETIVRLGDEQLGPRDIAYVKEGGTWRVSLTEACGLYD
jgi:hypothetical protein